MRNFDIYYIFEYFWINMDLNKQHEFDSNEERSRAMYYNRGINVNEVRPHGQYYSPDRMVSNKKACDCKNMPDNIMCNGCRTNGTRESWASEHISRTNLRNADVKSTIKQNPHYVNLNNANRSCWQQNCTTAIPPTDRNIVIKPSTTDTNYSYKQQYHHQQQQQQPESLQPLQRANSISTYCKERSYNEYSPNHDTKISYISSAPSATAIYNVDSRNNNMSGVLRTGKSDQQVITPSNMLASKDQHPSPNYARKCPQIFSPGEQNSTHINLYMPTPQFSSDKFTNAHNHPKLRMASPQHEYRTLNNAHNSSGHKHLTEKSKLVDNPIRLASPIPSYTSASKVKYQLNELMQPSQSNVMQQQSSYGNNAVQTKNINYYSPHAAKVHTPEMSPIIMKQSHVSYQYSSSPVPPPPSSHLMSVRGSTQEIEYVKKEVDPCDSHSVPVRNLYVNPYNTPPSSDSCCKESSSPFLPISNYRGESPQTYNKYSRIPQEIEPTNKLVVTNQNTPPLSRTSSFRNQTYYYEHSNNKYDSNPYGTPSPAAATVASPSSVLPTSQSQIHHNDYTPPSHHIQSYQPTINENSRPSGKIHDNVPPPPQPPPHIDAYDMQLSQTSNMNCISNQSIPPQAAVTVQTPQTSKKSHIPKPNYRELISQAYAMRNAMSEEELNLQIIKKTLNVDTQVIKTTNSNMSRSVAAYDKVQQNPPHLGTVGKSPTNIPPSQDNYAREPYRTDIVPNHIHTQPKIPVGSVVQDIRQTIKQEEKVSSYSPLDLSMRTVKTKADSTEYKYKCLSSTNSPSVDCKYGLPRVDFTPNFALHTVDRNVIIKPNGHSGINRNEHVAYSSPEVSHIPPMAVQQADQVHFSKKHYAGTTVSKINSVHYESKAHTIETANELPSTSKSDSQRNSNSLVIKSTPKSVVNCDLNVCQIRPSVLESNPYAIKTIRTETIMTDRNILAVDQLPPDTSIMPLPKTVVTGPSQIPNIHPTGRTIESAQPTTQSNYHRACEQNPNYLGRKRHLHEYSNSNAKYSEPIIKQPRYQELMPKFEQMRSADISVIAVNQTVLEMERTKTAEKSIQAEIPCYQTPNKLNIPINNESIIVCKEEPITPTADVAPLSIPQTVPIKTETSFAARIRTKAELKGFTFNPPMETTELTVPAIPTVPAVIKKEPSTENTSVELPSISGLTEDFSQGSLLDFSWSNTCNNLVKQLLTNGKKKPVKKKAPSIKAELSEDDLPVSTIISNKSPIVSTQIDAPHIKEDSIENNISNIESTTTNNSYSKNTKDTNGNTKTTPISISQDTTFAQTAIPKKIGKVEREKLRQQQEKRFAARILEESSSESDNELDRRKTDRLKKPLIKCKVRNSNGIGEKNRFSDCGCDSSTESDDKIPLSKSIKNIKEAEQKEQLKTPKVKLEKNVEKADTNIKEKANERKELNRKRKETLSESSSNNKTNLSKKSINISKESEKLKTTLKETTNKTENKYKLNVPKSVEERKANTKNDEKPDKKSNSQNKVGLNTMTRSKRKRELELQIANSKVLRNDKIIRNSMTKIKRKYVKKFSNNQKDIVSRESSEILSTRLRTRSDNNVNKNKMNGIQNNTKKNKDKIENKKVQNSKKKERDEDVILAVYRYKRSLKIPPSLITIKHPHNQKITASLPDLESHCDEFKSTPNVKSNDESDLKRETQSEEPRSIIDVLHSRVINSATLMARTKTKTSKSTNSNSKNKKDTAQNSEPLVLGELLPDIKKEDDEGSNDGKKRHFSIFETKVLPTKTRTESKLQQRKEIIREIFVGDDRPASAPPEMIQTSDGMGKMTYEQTYEQFLQQMNIIINNEKLRKFGKASGALTTVSSSPLQIPHIKQEEDTESASAIDADEKFDCENQQDCMSTISGTNNFKRRRPTKYLRRKGSSGFDYIRKKKKPTPVGITTPQQCQVIKMEKDEDEIKIKTKTEDDVCREIQKWVLNKGVGQSTMHKAARQGYIDVIVYCLDRVGMNPDQKDNAGYTPLHEACTNGWLEIARILLQYGANHSAAAHSGIRPLHEASENDHEEIVRLLLSYGADPLLATYSGQTPLMLASSTAVRDILNNHLSDVQNTGPDKKPWKFKGPWEIFDPTEYGYDVFGSAPNFTCDMSRALRKSSVSTMITNKKQFNQYGETSSKTVMDECAVMLDNIDRFNTVGLQNNTKTKAEFLVENSDSEGEIFEFEEADVLLPPLYLLKDEGSDKWVLLSDLCNLLKVKSKDTLLNKIYPTSSISSAQKNLMRELKMSDFLEKATCLQLLCAGEKINICASKVVLIKYNESVRNLLGVKTILMKF